MRISVSCVLVGAALLLVAGTHARSQSSAATPKYTAVEIPAPAGFTDLDVLDLNGSDAVVGRAFGPGDESFALVRSGGVWTSLGIGEATGINASGVVIGSNADGRATTWSNAVPTVIPGLPTFSEGLAINDAGEVIASSAGEIYRVSPATEVTNLGGFPTADSTEVADINNGGVFVGAAYLKSGGSRPFRYFGGAFQDLLGTEPETTSGLASGINASGRIAGVVNVDGVDQAAVWMGPGMRTDLSTPARFSSIGSAINASGTVVGQVYETDPLDEGKEYAAAWINGTLVNLDKATNNGALKLLSALKITDAGKILALSSLGDELRIFLLTPAGGTPVGNAELSGTLSNFTKKVNGRGARATVSLRGSLTVGNTGAAKLKKATKASVFLSSDTVLGSDVLLKSVTIPVLKEGTSRAIALNAMKLAAGVDSAGKFVIVVIDPGNLIEEDNEANNTVISGVLP